MISKKYSNKNKERKSNNFKEKLNFNYLEKNDLLFQTTS